MERVFLDTNIYIDIVKRAKEKWKHLRSSLLFISPLSTHILFYSYKLKVPNFEVDKLHEQFSVVPLSKYIINKSLEGPTKDLEDNIQLHSAAEANCDLFITHDAKLLDLKFFGKTQVVSDIHKN